MVPHRLTCARDLRRPLLALARAHLDAALVWRDQHIAAARGVAATAANTTGKYTVNKGQVLQISQAAELTGSAIAVDKPIGVTGGASCLSIDNNATACDSAHQALPPVNALGSRYVGVRYRNRYDGMVRQRPTRDEERRAVRAHGLGLGLRNALLFT